MAPERRRNRRAAANAKLPRGEVVWPKRFTVARLDVGLMNELFEDEVLNKGLLRPCEMPKMLFCDGCIVDPVRHDSMVAPERRRLTRRRSAASASESAAAPR